MEQEGQVSREESVGAKMVVGVMRERLALAVTMERSWKPSVERMVAKREGGYVRSIWEWGDGGGKDGCAVAVVKMRMTAAKKLRRRFRVALIV